MLELKRNIAKSSKKRKAPDDTEPGTKKGAVTKPCQLLQRYPVKVNADFVECFERNSKAMKEMEKARPQDTFH